MCIYLYLEILLCVYTRTCPVAHASDGDGVKEEGTCRPPFPPWAVELTWHLPWVPRFSWEL